MNIYNNNEEDFDFVKVEPTNDEKNLKVKKYKNDKLISEYIIKNDKKMPCFSVQVEEYKPEKYHKFSSNDIFENEFWSSMNEEDFK